MPGLEDIMDEGLSGTAGGCQAFSKEEDDDVGCGTDDDDKVSAFIFWLLRLEPFLYI